MKNMITVESKKNNIFIKVLFLSILGTRLYSLLIRFILRNNQEIMTKLENDIFHHYYIGLLLLILIYPLRKVIRPHLLLAIGAGIFIEELAIFFDDLGLKTDKYYHSNIDIVVILLIISSLYSTYLVFRKIKTNQP